MNEIFIYFREKSQTLTKMNTSNRVKRDQGQVKTYKIQNKCLKNIKSLDGRTVKTTNEEIIFVKRHFISSTCIF